MLFTGRVPLFREGTLFGKGELLWIQDGRENMKAEIICADQKLLLGEKVNRAGAYIAGRCISLGLTLMGQSIPGEDRRRLGACLRQAFRRSDVLFLLADSGEAQKELLRESAGKVLKKEIAPETEVLEEKGKLLFFFSGSEKKICQLFETQALPCLEKNRQGVLCTHILKICGTQEGQAAKALGTIRKRKNPEILLSETPGETEVCLRARGEDESQARKLLEPAERKLWETFGSHIYGKDKNASLEAAVVELLKEKGLTVTTVESCTAGALAARIVNVSGASQVLKQGFVTYSNKAKRQLVKVKKSTLKEHGAVSRKCAKEMAQGGARAAGADAALSVTGLAGPEGGTPQTPVGTVFIGCCLKGKTEVLECHFQGDRTQIRAQAVSMALTLLRDCLLKEETVQKETL